MFEVLDWFIYIYMFLCFDFDRCEKGLKLIRVKSGRIKRSREVWDESVFDEN